MGISIFKNVITTNETQRPAIAPVNSAAKGSIAAALATAITGALVGWQDGLTPFAPVVVVALTGIATGVGNAARSTGGWTKALLGWIG
jgi:hypothetical protein